MAPRSKKTKRLTTPCVECKKSLSESKEKALLMATESGHKDCVKAVIDAGADVNTTDPWGKTALVIAAQEGFTECVEVLLTAEADVKKDDVAYCTHIYEATAESRHTKCLELLVKAGFDVNKGLYHAIQENHDECFSLLLSHGADVNQPNDKGVAALMAAAESGSYKCLDLIIQSGADVNYVDKDGNTALMLSTAVSGHEDRCYKCYIGEDDTCEKCKLCDKCVEILLTAGADVNRRNNKGKTVIMLPRYFMFSRSISMLLRHGAKINYIDNSPDPLSGINNANALTKYLGFQSFVRKTIALWLYAAGEALDERKLLQSYGHLIFFLEKTSVPTYLTDLQINSTNLSLKRMCREAVRKHLLNVDPHENLFVRIPQLGLPSILSEYLLYDVSLDDELEDDW